MIKAQISNILNRIEIYTRLRSIPTNRRRVKILKKYLQEGGRGCEIGVYKGWFSESLMKEIRPEELHLIDPWFVQQPLWEWSTGNKSCTSALIRILKRLKHQIDMGIVHIKIGDDQELLLDYEDDFFDWAYLDSSHQYEHTKIELALLCKKVKKGGVIAGDDYIDDPGHRHHGVAKAVKEYAERGCIEVLIADSTSKQFIAINKHEN